MFIFSFRKINKKDILIILYPVLIAFESTLVKDSIIQNLSLYYFIVYFSTAILGGLPSFIHYFYTQIKASKDKQSKAVSKKSKFTLIYITHEHKKRAISLLIIFFLAALNSVYVYFTVLNTKFKEIRVFSILAISNTFFNGLFSYFFLKTKIYKHQHLALLLLMCGIIILNSSFYYLIQDWNNLLYLIAASILTALVSVESKKIMKDKYLHPITFLLIYGLIGMIIVGIIFIVIACFYPNILPLMTVADFSEFWNTTRESLRFIGFIVLRTCFSLLFFGVIYYWNSLDESILRHFSKSFELIIACFIMNPNGFTIASIIIGSIMTILGVIIYYELVILNFCGLDEYTKAMVDQRGENEINTLEIRHINAMGDILNEEEEDDDHNEEENV